MFSSLILGITFSVGWTPCNGPIVGTILFLASFEKDYMRAGGMMSIYSLGFAIPFFYYQLYYLVSLCIIIRKFFLPILIRLSG